MKFTSEWFSCLYKKVSPFEKEFKFEHKIPLVKVLTMSLGKLALETLLSGDPLIRTAVGLLAEVGEEVV